MTSISLQIGYFFQTLEFRMALPLVALPVLHSSGAWIASAGGSYIAGTLSSTWLGALIFGNSGLLSLLGLVSSAGMLGMSGSLATWTTGLVAAFGSTMGAAGLGGLAAALGIAPIATFLGLTPVGWAILGTVAVLCAGFGVVALSSGWGGWLGSGLEAIGLGRVAQALGLAEPTFLGLTLSEWMTAGGVAAAVLGAGGLVAWLTVWRARGAEKRGIAAHDAA